MPDRAKLTREVFRKIMLSAPDNQWIVATIAEGEILGVGGTVKVALDEAERKRPDLGIGQLAILWKDLEDEIP